MLSNEEGLSAEVVPCDRVDSHAKHDSPIMLMAWRAAPPRSCRQCKLGDHSWTSNGQRSMLSKIGDRHTVCNDCPHRTAVADFRFRSPHEP